MCVHVCARVCAHVCAHVCAYVCAYMRVGVHTRMPLRWWLHWYVYGWLIHGLYIQTHTDRIKIDALHTVACAYCVLTLYSCGLTCIMKFKVIHENFPEFQKTSGRWLGLKIFSVNFYAWAILVDVKCARISKAKASVPFDTQSMLFLAIRESKLTNGCYSEGDSQGLPGFIHPRVLGIPTISFQ